MRHRWLVAAARATRRSTALSRGLSWLELLARVTLAPSLLSWTVLSKPARGAVTPEQAAMLHGALTPVGAERAGNAAGTIPPWNDGPTSDALLAHEVPLLTIGAADASRYATLLPEGALALFRRDPDYRIRVFPTHRTATLPQAVYDAVAHNAVSAHAAAAGIAFGIAGAAGGVPFPIPANGAEVVWNQLLAFWGPSREDRVETYVAAGDGSIERTAGYREMTDFPYYAPGATPDSIGGYYFKTRRLQDWPPSRVGEGYIAWQPLNVATDRFVAWRYLPGEHRARRAPSLSYDTPDPDSSGLESLDDYYLFFGGQDRYVFRLLGKREMLIPYNNPLALSGSAAMLPTHANQDAIRYERHRVWVVEGTLAPGQHHVAPRRRLYIDEDTWIAVYSDAWDEDGRLWKFAQAAMTSVSELPAMIGGSRFVYDLQHGGYCYDFVLAAAQDYRITPMHPVDTFSAAAMAADSLR